MSMRKSKEGQPHYQKPEKMSKYNKMKTQYLTENSTDNISSAELVEFY